MVSIKKEVMRVIEITDGKIDEALYVSDKMCYCPARLGTSDAKDKGMCDFCLDLRRWRDMNSKARKILQMNLAELRIEASVFLRSFQEHFRMGV